MLARCRPVGPPVGRPAPWLGDRGQRRAQIVDDSRDQLPDRRQLFRAEKLLADGPLVEQLDRHADLVGQMLRQRLFIAAEDPGAIALVHLQNPQHLALRQHGHEQQRPRRIRRALRPGRPATGNGLREVSGIASRVR